MVGPEDIAANLARLREGIDRALEKAGRNGVNIVLVAVTKTHPAEYIDAAIKSGITDIGENRVQEFESKRPRIKGQARWHLIGHLQKNKINKALTLFDLIQSIDSFELAREISKRAEKDIEVLVQVNSSGEESKYGFEPDEAKEETLRIAELEHIRVKGLMTIGPFVDDEIMVRKSFVPVKEIFDDLKQCETDNVKMNYLSMGMSNDYAWAIAEGANMIRVGSLIFGPRG
jgi:pyridoxal phosphate enzyme (YggS family)